LPQLVRGRQIPIDIYHSGQRYARDVRINTDLHWHWWQLFIEPVGLSLIICVALSDIKLQYLAEGAGGA